MNQIFYDLIYLCGCAVNGTVPSKDRTEQMDLEQLYAAANYHTLTGITASALESTGIQDNKFRTAKEKASRKNIFLDAERKKLFSFCEENGIWYMPLKGSVLKELYPDFSMRQMADNDILFDAGYQQKIKEYFESNGYQTVSCGKGNHDVYEKPPVLNFEMHTSLFGKSHDTKWHEYYGDVKKRLVKDCDNSYGYHFSDEDFYIYIITHEYKHYSNSGTGIRSLLDCYVYLKAKQVTLNWTYIEAECKKLGISAFEKQSRGLAGKVFGNSNSELSDEDKIMLERYLNSGTYGTLKQSIEKSMEKFAEKTGSRSKLRYIMNRLFPGSDFFEANYNPLFRHRIFLPAGWIYRIFRSAVISRKRIMNELKIVLNEK